MSETASSRIAAVIWDFDGTLVDTRAKNMAVNRVIVEEITGRPWSDWPVLQSLAEYERLLRRVRNWRDLYMTEFGLSASDTDRAGSMWGALQAADRTPAPVFDGISATLDALTAMPHGIVSQNSSATIADLLGAVGLGDRFATIIGYEEVGRDRQKPDPEGLLACLETLLEPRGGAVLFVGDHPTDTECAVLANEALGADDEPRVLAVAACFGDVCDADEWSTRPHFVARHPSDVAAIVRAQAAPHSK